jgi:hypothetical protein
MMYLRKRSSPNQALVMILNTKFIMLFRLKQIMNELRIVLVIMSAILMLEDHVRGKHSLKGLFNVVQF